MCSAHPSTNGVFPTRGKILKILEILEKFWNFEKIPWGEGLLQLNSFSPPPAFSAKIVPAGAVSTPALSVVNLVIRFDCLWTDLVT